MLSSMLPSHRTHYPLAHSRLGAHIAALSEALLPRMREHNISLHFSEPSDSGTVMVDATRNPTAAYKIRGALASASAAQTLGINTVCTASAGNHGAGLAYAAQLLGLRAHIFVPENAPNVKVEKIQSFGATVERVGNNFDECLVAARAGLATLGTRAVMVHPFDEEAVVAGQGTIGLEILAHAQKLAASRQVSKVRIFVPVGGGGLASGVASVVKNLWPSNLPRPEVIGVIDESSPASLLGLYFGRPVRAIPDTIADGTRVALVGDTFISLAPLVDRMLTLPRNEIVDAMHAHYHKTGEILEPAGALALAGEAYSRRLGLLRNAEGTLSFALISGRNVDRDVFDNTISQSTSVSRKYKAHIAYDVKIPERPGQLRMFLNAVRDYNISGLTYKQKQNSLTGTLRVEFEEPLAGARILDRRIKHLFPGSRHLAQGEHSIFAVGAPVAQQYRDELVTLEDSPGSFLRFINELGDPAALGSVGFLFYRKPSSEGARAQVVIGRAPTRALAYELSN